MNKSTPSPASKTKSNAKAATKKSGKDHDAVVLEGSASHWATAILNESRARGQTLSDTAREFELSPGYFNTMLHKPANETDRVTRINPDTLRKSAAFLRTSPLNCHLMSGMLTVADLYNVTDHEAETWRLFSLLEKDIEMAAYLLTKEEFKGLSIKSRYSYVLLAEQARQRAIMEKMEILVPYKPKPKQKDKHH